jgi:hypothetical protein
LCVAFAGAEFAFSIFDNEGNGIDGIDLGNLLRALSLNPTNATIEKLGGTKKKGELQILLLNFSEPLIIRCVCFQERRRSSSTSSYPSSPNAKRTRTRDASRTLWSA